MDIAKIGALYIAASAEITKENSIYCRLELKTAVSLADLEKAYRSFIEKNTLLTSVFMAGHWQVLPAENLRRCLDQESEHFASYRPWDFVGLQGEALPFRIRPVSERIMLVIVDHAFANGYGVVRWLEAWLCHLTQDGAALRPSVGRPLPPLLPSLFWALRYLFWSLWHHKKVTVDYSAGRSIPEVHDFRLVHYHLTPERLRSEIAAAEAQSLTLTSYLCLRLAQKLFQDNPEADRVCLSVPVDLSRGEGLPGNPTGSLSVNLVRRKDLATQIARSFLALRRGAPLGFLWLLNFFYRRPEKMRRFFVQEATRRLPARKPLGDFSAALSNLGPITSPILERHVESLTFYGTAQTPFIGLSTFKGTCTLALTFPQNLFSRDKVMASFGGYLQDLGFQTS